MSVEADAKQIYFVLSSYRQMPEELREKMYRFWEALVPEEEREAIAAQAEALVDQYRKAVAVEKAEVPPPPAENPS